MNGRQMGDTRHTGDDDGPESGPFDGAEGTGWLRYA